MADEDMAGDDLLVALAEHMEFEAELKDLGYDLDALEDTDKVKVLKTKDVDHPNIKVNKHLEIRKTSKRYLSASLMGAGKPGEADVRHWALTLQKFGPDPVGPGYDFDAPLESYKLEDAEIALVAAFAARHIDAVNPGEYVLVPKGAADKDSIALAAKALSEGSVAENDLKSLLAALAGDADLRASLASTTPDAVRRQLSAALTSGARHQAIEDLDAGISKGEAEHYFQTLFEQNWWMFGGRYTQLVDRRDYTTDETCDLPLLTASGYVEIIELKKPSEPLFKKMGNRWTMAGPVNDAVNQVAHYIGEAERMQDTLKSKYDVDFFKAKGKVVIGTLGPGDDDFDAKRRCLRAFNSHLHRVEVLTYSELRERSKKMVALDEQVAGITAPESIPVTQEGAA